MTFFLKKKIKKISGKKKVNKYNLPSIQLKPIEILQSSNTNRHYQYFFLSANVEHSTAIRKTRHINEFNTSPPKNITKNLIKIIVIHFN